jgi:hypothetical protein
MRRGFVITVAAAALVVSGVPAADAACGWVIQPTPNPSGASDSELNGVSCPSAISCIAVGASFSAPQIGTTTLAERWNGRTWTIQPIPNPAGSQTAGLNGVSCASPDSCTAVGWTFPIAGATQTLAEHWNGRTWTIQPTPIHTHSGETELLGISCPSAASCVAVGSSGNGSRPGRALAERWDGNTWRAQAIASPAGATHTGLQGISCLSASSCTATGSYTSSVGERALAEHWDGRTWSVQRTRNLVGASSSLSAVSCHTTASCTATGWYQIPAGRRALAEHWNGHRWSVQAIPVPPAAINSYLTGVSCALATQCTAVGYYVASRGSDLLMAEQWTGSKWVIQNAPAPPSSRLHRSLSEVSCATATRCTAVGYYSRGTSNFTLAEANHS